MRIINSKFLLLVLLLFAAFNVNAQVIEIYKNDLRKIDSIVATGYAYEALETTNRIYPEIRKVDSTSEVFKKLCTNYLFVLENLNLNEKAIDLANDMLSLNLGAEIDAHVYLTFALIHEKASNEELSRKYLYQSKPLIFSSANDSLKAVWLIRTSSFHRVLTQEKDSAFYYAQQAYHLSKKINNLSTWATASFLYGALTEVDSVYLSKMKEAVALSVKLNDFRLGSSQTASIGAYYYRKGDTIKGDEYLFKARNLSYRLKEADITGGIYQDLQDYYERKRDYKTALSYADSVLMNRIFIYETNDRLKVLSADFKLAQERLTNKLSEAELVAAEEEQQKVQLSYVVVGSILCLFVILIVAFDQRRRKRLATKNEKLIQQKNKALVKANEENKLLVKEMNHRLKNNLSTLSALLEIQANQSDSAPVKEALQKGIARIDLLSDLHRRVLSLEPQESILANQVLSDVVDAQLFLFNVKRTNVLIELDEFVLQTKSLTALTFVLNELLTNALKYGDKGAQQFIKISIKRIDQAVKVSVTNNGKAFPESHVISSAKNKSGLYITDLLVKQLGSKLQWESNEQTVTFYFTFLL